MPELRNLIEAARLALIAAAAAGASALLVVAIGERLAALV